jgi:Putative zinc-finger
MTADDRRTGPHPDLDTVADLHAGVLEEAEAAQVRAHVEGCPQCRQTLAALDRVGTDLRALPAPELPPDVAARMDATIADLRAEDLVERRAEAAEDELAQARLRRGRRLTRALTGVAAAVVVIAAGASVTAIVRAGGSTDNTSSAAGSAQSKGTADSGAGTVTPDGAAPHLVPEATIPTYDRAGLSAALPEIARRYPVPAAGTAAVPVGVGAMADEARRTACAASIPGAAGTLRAVAQITYQNQPAYVFVYDDGGLTGYVVSDQCGTPAALPGTVLDTVR